MKKLPDFYFCKQYTKVALISYQVNHADHIKILSQR